MKLTEWYSGDQKPVREGIYERKTFGGCTAYSQFGIRGWNSLLYSPNNGFAERKLTSEFQNLPWRGIEK